MEFEFVFIFKWKILYCRTGPCFVYVNNHKLTNLKQYEQNKIIVKKIAMRLETLLPISHKSWVNSLSFKIKHKFQIIKPKYIEYIDSEMSLVQNLIRKIEAQLERKQMHPGLHYLPLTRSIELIFIKHTN